MLTVIDQDHNIMTSGNFGVGKSPARDVIAFSKSNQPDLAGFTFIFANLHFYFG